MDTATGGLGRRSDVDARSAVRWVGGLVLLVGASLLAAGGGAANAGHVGGVHAEPGALSVARGPPSEDTPALSFAGARYSIGERMVVSSDNRAQSSPSSGASLPVSFNESEYFLHPRGKVFRVGASWLDADRTADNTELFDHVSITREDEDADVALAVEGFLDTEDPHICYGPLQFPALDVEECFPLLIGIRQQDGGLYLWNERPITERVFEGKSDKTYFRMVHYTNDYPTRMMELSAEDESSGFKAYREVIVRSPVVSPACDDFTARDADRMVCRFLDDRPLADLPTTTVSLRNGLPGLVQPKDNYDLVFAEEFNQNAADAATGCTDGLSFLDSSIWNHRGQGCDSVDVNGQSCENVEGGNLVMSFFKDTDGKLCRGRLHSFGKFSFKYGYWEVKYTVVGNGAQTDYHNYSMSLGGARKELRNIAAAYDLSIDDYESMTTLVGLGVIMSEIVPSTRMDIGHLYLNYNPFVFELDAPPLRTDRKIYYCRTDFGYLILPTSGCEGAPVTVTKGLEWTPRGYLAYVKVDGVHDELQRFPLSLTRFYTMTPDDTSSFIYQEDDLVEFLGEDRNRFIETYPTDDGTIDLEQLGVMHVPMPLWFHVWGWGPSSTADTMVKLDYMRVFQPRDHYSNMEPHYG